jgi:two-component system, chemotaxis family, response regulator Rcp1
MSRELIGRPMEIMLVEDNFSDAALTMNALEKGGVKHRMTLVRDAEEALEFLRRQGKFAKAPRPDLILLDMILPKMDGGEMLAEMRADPDLASIPVVVITGSKEYEQKLRDQQLAVEGFLTKPVDMPKFLALVKELKHHWMEDVILPRV